MCGWLTLRVAEASSFQVDINRPFLLPTKFIEYLLTH